MPKTPPAKHGELKTAVLKVRLTPTAKDGLRALAKNQGLSISELLERIGRGIV